MSSGLLADWSELMNDKSQHDDQSAHITVEGADPPFPEIRINRSITEDNKSAQETDRSLREHLKVSMIAGL